MDEREITQVYKHCPNEVYLKYKNSVHCLEIRPGELFIDVYNRFVKNMTEKEIKARQSDLFSDDEWNKIVS